MTAALVAAAAALQLNPGLTAVSPIPVFTGPQHALPCPAAVACYGRRGPSGGQAIYLSSPVAAGIAGCHPDAVFVFAHELAHAYGHRAEATANTWAERHQRRVAASLGCRP